jgi:hypothetical protein
MKYEIDGETADNICRIVLRETIKNLKTSIKQNKAEIKIKGSKAPKAWLEDLAYDLKQLEAVEVVYEYFGGKNKC